jgi:site-specific DNA-methyltransferase (adenine-specific)
MNKYNVILADPPWQFDNVKTGGSLSSGSADKYPVLSLEKLKSLDLSFIANDAYLFLWATNAMLPEALGLLEAWGFEYKTIVTWVKFTKNKKLFYGLGAYFRNSTEQLLVGVRGNVKALRCQNRNVIMAKHVGHSMKPVSAYRLIESSVEGVPNCRMIELFARHKRKGWDVWGLEVESDIEIRFDCERTEIDRFI